ncbi:MAG TPA: transposase, partial [Chthoniobacterales bacterium]
EIRKTIYTTNAIESLHMRLRKVLKTRGHFPNDEAATKLIYLALRNITKKWENPPITWKLAAAQFAMFGERSFAAETEKSSVVSNALNNPKAGYSQLARLEPTVVWKRSRWLQLTA